VDASTVVSWVLDDETSVEANAAIESAVADGAYVPSNFITEVTHALLTAERRGRIDEVSTGVALAEILALPISIEDPDPHTVLALARTHRLTGYDAAYLALAIRAHVPLATIDRALAAAARAEGSAYQPN
ncbi:MAG TPA: type II toxin-antitoxin system VapC family toxin, partial [Verrucomicrobiae bacterium]|nr:type II toxin-antitoxin system VapC family toxin [Verrucomicrobiae bacterium]